MKKSIILILSFALLVNFTSCSNEDEVGVKTTLKGHVSDDIRGINISGYKIVLVKSWSSCSNFMCGLRSEEIATTYTDTNGDYSITFNYKVKEGESYTLEEQYYGTPYYPEYLKKINIVAGKINTVNINAWEPIALKLNVKVANNNNTPLMIGNLSDGSNSMWFNTEDIYEQNINKTYNLRSRPDSDIKIIFWYYVGSHSSRTLHQKTILYHTSLDDINALDYTIDCSAF